MTPKRMPLDVKKPSSPAPALFTVKASFHMAVMAAGIRSRRRISTAAQTTRNPTVMKGTSFSVRAEMRFAPPSTVTTARTATTPPVIRGGTPKPVSMAPATALIWRRLPMVMALTRQRMAKTTARSRPKRGRPLVFSPSST